MNIEKKFSQGKNLDNLILLIEKTLSNTPFSFKLWNYYSACLRAKNKFQEAQELATFRAHSAKLREYNLLVVQNLKEKQWSLNKSKKIRINF